MTALQSQSPSARPKFLRVLFADDNRSFSAMLEYELTSRGDKVVLASDGQEAWEKLSAGQFDVVVTDHQMPRINGLELVKRITEGGQFSGTIIVASSVLRPDDAERYRALGVKEVVNKTDGITGVVDALDRVRRP